MDRSGKLWYFPDMTITPIPVWQLYGEERPFPDIAHVERIVDRAAGLEWRIAPHRHLHLHQLFVLTSGRIEISADAQVMRPEPPVVVNMPPGTVHGFRFSQGTEGFVLTLPTALFPELFGAGAEAAGAASRVFAAEAPEALVALFATLHRDHGQTALPLRQTLLRGLVGQIVASVLGLLAAADDAPRGGDARMARFAALVAAHLRDRWSVAEYADAMALSPRHLSRICQQASGLSAGGYIEAHLIREACRQLVYTRMPVQALAFQLGFEDASYFSRVFQRGTGLSPSAYRARFEG
ncbi:MAG: helix-turn-helix domain-containing protein [Paracoccaceae bacterium]